MRQEGFGSPALDLSFLSPRGKDAKLSSLTVRVQGSSKRQRFHRAGRLPFMETFECFVGFVPQARQEATL